MLPLMTTVTDDETLARNIPVEEGSAAVLCAVILVGHLCCAITHVSAA